jgi:hypothetical protein
MTHVDPKRAERERNASALFGWIAAAATLVVAFLFLMFSGPSDRVASDSTTPATTGQGTQQGNSQQGSTQQSGTR